VIGDAYETDDQVGGGPEPAGLDLAQRTHIDSGVEDKCPGDVRNCAVSRPVARFRHRLLTVVSLQLTTTPVC